MFFNFKKIKEIEDMTSEEMSQWCKENLTNGEVTVGHIAVFIESEIDASAFKLRWI